MLNKGITIKARIGLTMAFLAALLLIIGVLGLTGMSHSNDAYHATFTNEMPSAVDIGNAELFAARERLALDRAAFLFGTPEVAATVERARQVEMTYVFQGHIEKIPILEQIVADAKIHTDEIAYAGDDLTDVVVMNRVGFAIATANARAEVKAKAHLVTAAAGGKGAIREAIEVILKAQGFWPELLKKYEV